MEEFVQQQGLTLTVLLDETSSTAKAYKVSGIPTSFFVDGEGVIQAKHNGALDEVAIARYVAALSP